MKGEHDLSAEHLTEAVPTFANNGQDHRDEWARLLQGTEEELPTEASFANHFFNWAHIIDGERREGFDCTKENSFILIPPQTYLSAYRDAKGRREI